MNDETVERIGRELVEAIEAAIAADSRVQECLARARAAGLGFRVALNQGRAQGSRGAGWAGAAPPSGAAPARTRGPVVYEITESDRRFLRSLRIAI